MAEKNREHITNQNCNGFCKMPFDDLIALSGYSGAVAFDEEKLKLRNIYYDKILDIANFEIEDENFSEFHRRIEFTTRRIDNAHLIGTKTVTCVAVKLLLRQVEYAEKHGFHTIYLQAFGDPPNKKIYNGYIKWGELGFLMEDDTEFLEKMKERGLPYGDLYQLLNSADRNIWVDEIGDSWFGVFYIEKGSDSRRKLKDYIARNHAYLAQNGTDLSFYPSL